jgi:1-acyl-sn-glycerol-3-phosphate acyltransferase
MFVIVGIIRLLLFVMVLVGGSLVCVGAAFVPGRVRGVRPAALVVRKMAQMALRIFGVTVECPEAERFQEHHGFIFANHNSYLDILVILHLLPARFVAKAEVKAIPFIGMIARSIGCVFVKRESKSSRARARAQLGEVEHYPAIMIFPEGKTNRTAEPLLPFRYGAFEIAVQYEVAYLPCAIVYSHLEIVRGGSDTLVKSAWRLASHRVPLRVKVVPLATVRPKPEDNAVLLAEETQQGLYEVLVRSNGGGEAG